MHTDSGLAKLFENPVLNGLTPAAVTLDDLYVVPGAPLDAKGNVRVCAVLGGDTTFRIGWSTATQTTVTYFEYDTPIAEGCSLDLFLEDKWFPPTTTLWVYSASGGVHFTYQGLEVASETATPQFTGS